MQQSASRFEWTSATADLQLAALWSRAVEASSPGDPRGRLVDFVATWGSEGQLFRLDFEVLMSGGSTVLVEVWTEGANTTSVRVRTQPGDGSMPAESGLDVGDILASLDAVGLEALAGGTATALADGEKYRLTLDSRELPKDRTTIEVWLEGVSMVSGLVDGALSPIDPSGTVESVQPAQGFYLAEIVVTAQSGGSYSSRSLGPPLGYFFVR